MTQSSSTNSQSNNSARQLHSQAWDLNEQGEFSKALEMGQAAISAYIEEQDLPGLVEMYAQMSLFYRTWFSVSPELPVLQTLATQMCRVGLALGEGKLPEESLSLLRFTFGKCLADSGDLRQAVEQYAQAIASQPKDDSGNVSSIVLDMQTHLACAKYAMGEEAQLSTIEQIVSKLLTQKDRPAYDLATWASGAFLRLAKTILENKKDKVLAKNYVQKAKDIIDANPKLVVRKEQMEKIQKLLI